MRTLATSMLLSALALGACDTRLPDPTLPRVGAAQPVTASLPDPSVPAAATVVTAPTTATAKDEPAARATGTLTKAQESNAMPMPGQANNHSSTALDPAARAASAAAPR
jgi:hypothetical protein